MIIRQLTLDSLRGIILRLFPGLAGYHVFRHAIIKKVYEGASVDLAINPAMKVDLQLCKHDFSVDNAHKVKRNVRLAGSSEFIQAPPNEGTYVLVHFPYWMSNTATVISVLYLNRLVQPEKDTIQIRDAENTKISAKSELILGEGNDQAVLGNELISALQTICDKIVALGQSDNMGAPLPTLANVQVDLEMVKQTLADNILSDIKIGKGTDAPRI